MSEPHFNGLSNAEVERLDMLAEEAAEVIQAISKIKRHGYESFHPDSPNGPTNRQMLENEIVDFYAIAGVMEDVKDVTVEGEAVRQAIKKKRRYTHHQDGEGW